MISLREQFLVREMESEDAAPSAGAADRHELAGAFDNVILDLRSSKGLATQPGGGPIAADKVSPPLRSPPAHVRVIGWMRDWSRLRVRHAHACVDVIYPLTGQPLGGKVLRFGW